MAGPWGLEVDQLHPRGDHVRLRDRDCWETPVRLLAFDILTRKGDNVASRSYVEPRDALTARISKSGTVQVPPSRELRRICPTAHLCLLVAMARSGFELCDLIHFGVQVIGALLFCRKLFQCRDCTPEEADSFLGSLLHLSETRYQTHLDFPSPASRNFKPSCE